MMKLSNYLIHLVMNKDAAVDDRILYLFDTVNNQYYTKVIHPSSNDQAYVFFESDEPFHDYEKVEVIKAWTVTNAVNCMMGLDLIISLYGESEV